MRAGHGIRRNIGGSRRSSTGAPRTNSLVVTLPWRNPGQPDKGRRESSSSAAFSAGPPWQSSAYKDRDDPRTDVRLLIAGEIYDISRHWAFFYQDQTAA